MKRKAAVHNEFSKTLPRKFVEITAYQEQHSASAISGTIRREIFLAISECVVRPSSYKTMAHCRAKQSSAMVATDLPARMPESQVSNRQMRWTSARGRIERKTQTKT